MDAERVSVWKPRRQHQRQDPLHAYLMGGCSWGQDNASKQWPTSYHSPLRRPMLSMRPKRKHSLSWVLASDATRTKHASSNRLPTPAFPALLLLTESRLQSLSVAQVPVSRVRRQHRTKREPLRCCKEQASTVSIQLSQKQFAHTWSTQTSSLPSPAQPPA